MMESFDQFVRDRSCYGIYIIYYDEVVVVKIFSKSTTNFQRSFELLYSIIINVVRWRTVYTIFLFILCILVPIPII